MLPRNYNFVSFLSLGLEQCLLYGSDHLADLSHSRQREGSHQLDGQQGRLPLF